MIRTTSALALIVLSSCECLEPGAPPPPPPPVVNGDPFTTALPSEARRLTQFELDRTLRDTIGDLSSPGTRLIDTDKFTPYDNDYTLQLSSEALIDSLEGLTVDVANRTLADPTARALIIPCAPAAPDDAACFREVVTSVGKRLLRRPLDADEVEAYMGFLAYATESSPYYATGFDTAVEVALRAFLMDPEFLFRIEVGSPTGEAGVVRLNPYETATRMAYTLWGSAPDDALLAEAEAGRLDDAAARRANAERMINDIRAKEQLAHFHAMWLGYRAIPTEPTLAARFATETNALLDRIIFDEKRDYLDVFTLEETFLDDTLADHYGLPRPDSSPGWVSLADTGRAGILSQGAVLASFSKFTDTSPTQRGILVRNRLMCLNIDPPPPTVNADEPPPDQGSVTCKIPRYELHTQSSSCNACHSQMDPIGFGLETYDIEGRFRTHDDGDPNCVIDTTKGALPGFGAFNGPRELAQRLVENDIVGPCFMKQISSWDAGRALTADEQQVVDAWSGKFIELDRRLDALLLERIAGDQFVTKREPEPGVTP